MEEPTRKKRWRLRPRFGLRTLLVLFTLISVGGGWIGIWLRHAGRQQSAVAQLREAGASVRYEVGRRAYQWRERGDVVPGAATGWEAVWDYWRAEVFGIDAVYRVDRVDLFQQPDVEQLLAVQRLPALRELYVVIDSRRPFEPRDISPEAWRALCGCRQVEQLTLKRNPFEPRSVEGISAMQQLRTLCIRGGRITRDDAEEVARLQGLRELQLQTVQISDDAAEPLGRLTQLESLVVRHSGLKTESSLTDRGTGFVGSMVELRSLSLEWMQRLTGEVLRSIEPLKKLESLSLGGRSIDGSEIDRLAGRGPSLRSLNLIGTAVGDEAMPAIGKWSNLRSLNLGFTPVSDRGLVHLEGLGELRTLSLSSSGVTDAGMQSVAKLTKLEELFLTRLPITDDGVRFLMGLKSLKQIYLDGTKVSAKAKAELKKATGVRVL